jgi:hypothetical protein
MCVGVCTNVGVCVCGCGWVGGCVWVCTNVGLWLCVCVWVCGWVGGCVYDCECVEVYVRVSEHARTFQFRTN